jgi:hypothetical protein
MPTMFALLSIHCVHFTLAPQCLFDVEHLFDFIVKFCICFYVKFCLYVIFFEALSLHEVVFKTMSLREDIYLLEVFFLYEIHIHLCASFMNDNNFLMLHMIIILFSFALYIGLFFLNYERLSHVDGY